MPEVFRDKAGNPLENGLYNLSIVELPLSFQNYALVSWGNFRTKEAIFQDYKGRLYHLSAVQVSALATKATSTDVKPAGIRGEGPNHFTPCAQTTTKYAANQEENDTILDELFGSRA